MSDTLKIVLAQFNPHVGQIVHNLARIRAARAEAARLGAALMVTPEMFPSPATRPRTWFANRPSSPPARRPSPSLRQTPPMAAPGLMVGGPWLDGRQALQRRVSCWTRAASWRAGRSMNCPITACSTKNACSTPARRQVRWRFAAFASALMICEDWWFPAVAETLAESGAEMLLSINGSPYEVGKQPRRVALAVERVVESGLPYVFCAQVGGQDELVFDGASFVLNADRSLAVQMPCVRGGVDADRVDGATANTSVCTPQALAPEFPDLESVYRCMMLGLGDYVRKNGFPGVILGLSGGIDSALLGRRRRRCARSGDGAQLHAAQPLHQPAQPGRCRRVREAARHSPATPCSIDPGDGSVRRGAGADLRRAPGRHHRGEHPVARARA